MFSDYTSITSYIRMIYYVNIPPPSSPQKQEKIVFSKLFELLTSWVTRSNPLRKNSKMEVLGIKLMASWLLVRHSNHSVQTVWLR